MDDGLTTEVDSDCSSISGLAIWDSPPTRARVTYIAANDVAIGCTISGMNASGTSPQPNYYGIYINGQGAYIRIATATQWPPNLISGNSYANVLQRRWRLR